MINSFNELYEFEESECGNVVSFYCNDVYYGINKGQVSDKKQGVLSQKYFLDIVNETDWVKE